MYLHLTWEQIALRLGLASVASFVIGLNRDENGHPAGVRTTMLVCLAATLAMLQVNLLLGTSGKPPSSFVVMDLMRLPLGILSGIGFIGAGVIIKRGAHVNGVTTAATIWYVTVLGLLFGGGNLYLGVAGSLIAFAVLWALKLVEKYIVRECRGSLRLTFSSDQSHRSDESDQSAEDTVRLKLLAANCNIVHWRAMYDPADTLLTLDCELRWKAPASRVPNTPPQIEQLRGLPGVRSLAWRE